MYHAPPMTRAYRQQAIELDHAGSTLRGMAYLPSGGGRYPTVLMLHGFLGHRIESGYLFVQLGRALAERGIAAVTFDFRGSGESDGSFDESLVTGQVADAVRVSQWLTGQVFVDRSRMAVLGFSLGGLVAVCTAARTALFRAMVLLAPTTVTNLCRHAGEPDCRPRKPVIRGAHELHPHFFDDLRTLDPLADCTAHPRPTLVVQGTGDTAVTPAISGEYVTALRAGGAAVTVETIDGADHSFAHPDWRAQLLKIVPRWLVQRLA